MKILLIMKFHCSGVAILHSKRVSSLCLYFITLKVNRESLSLDTSKWSEGCYRKDLPALFLKMLAVLVALCECPFHQELGMWVCTLISQTISKTHIKNEISHLKIINLQSDRIDRNS